jgi:hypothetical protein
MEFGTVFGCIWQVGNITFVPGTQFGGYRNQTKLAKEGIFSLLTFSQFSKPFFQIIRFYVEQNS